jgi:hypothetical protein
MIAENIYDKKQDLTSLETVKADDGLRLCGCPILIVIVGSIVIALVIRRLRSLREKRAAGTRQLFQRIMVTAMAAIAMGINCRGVARIADPASSHACASGSPAMMNLRAKSC